MALKFLPPGFRFHPTDLELILYYLKRKIMGKKLHYEAIAEVNIYKFSPWDLPDKSSLKSKDLEWFFFCPREKKYASGSRVKRATENGYWKTTGKDRIIRYNKQTVGTVKTLVFHLGHAPQGERTDWVLYEYRIVDEKLAAAGLQDTYVLCKVFKKDGVGPRNGAQYGAPFNEADWADDGDAENQAISFASDSPQMTMQMQTEEETLARGLNFSVGDTSGSRLVAQGPPPSAGGTANEIVATETDDNDIAHLLASFTDEDMLLSNDNGVNQGGLIGDIGNESLPCSDGHDIYNGLGDLDNWGLRNEGTLDFSLMQSDVYYLNHMPFQDNSAYIELDDLLPPLDRSNGVATTDQFSNNEIYGAPSHENVQQLYSGAPFSGKGLCAPCSNGLSAPHGGSYQVNDSSHQFQMFDHQIYQGSNALSGLHFTSGKTRNMGHPSYNMERGSQKLDCFSRLMECNPAHQIPTAALAYSSPYIGSSIHIKAEVTHRAGECTNEALTVMMGGSGSCWCFWQDIRKLQSLLVMIYPLPCLVEFRFDLICFLSGTVRWSHYFCFYYNCCHLHLNEDSVIIFSSTIIIGNLIDSFVNIIKSFKHFPKFNNLSV